MAWLRNRGTLFRISLVDRPIGMVADLVANGEVDLGIGSVEARLQHRVRLKSQLLTRDTLTVVSAKGSRLARAHNKKDDLTWSDLAKHGGNLVLVGRIGGQWESLLRSQLEQHTGLRIEYEVQLLATALELVRNDLGWAVLPTFASRSLDRAAFSVARLRDSGPRWEVYALAKSNQAKNPAITAFIEAALAVLERPDIQEDVSAS